MDVSKIKFGTDGWRGIIAEDYTFENVRAVGRAIASYVLNEEDWKKGLVVGYDTRFGSKRFAEAVCEELAAAGLWVRLSDDYTPTPAISYAAKNLDTAGGVMITSSHNPWNWNGVKFKGNFGGSATPAMISKIEQELYAGAAPKHPGGKIETVDFKKDYIAAILKLVDLDAIQRTGFKFAIDCMYGSGRNILADIFAEHGIKHLQIRADVNPLFPGINPEPILPHVKALQDVVIAEACDAGLVVDGDADRVGAVAGDGSFVDSHKCYAVLLSWLLDYKKWPGAVTRAYNTTKMLDRIAAKHGREFIEHGIGFKYVTDIVMSGKQVLIGGEESGGIGIPSHLPERDGILNSLLIANAMADYGKTLKQLVDDLQGEYGQHHYGRRDLHIPEEVKQGALRRAAAGVQKIGPYKILGSGNLDGIKFYLDAPRNGNGAEAWLLLRASGTEPLMRVYCEAASPEIVREILGAAEEFVFEKATTA
ncbi:MAG TPA: phosphoglucomutase/phosphomannomutase family protein [Clostridia bacterium]|nr:phosphoglucomutase/phosphomannomutase family protein [Clostridia bacterium]